jgi:polysaccharide pyruvyl transferase WcaK-like protein
MIGRSVFLVNDTSVSGHPGCVTVMSVIRDNLEMRGFSIAGRWPLGVEPQMGLTLNPALRCASAVIVNGEGTLHNTLTRPGARRLLQTLRQIRLVTRSPIFLINATIENLRPGDFEALKLCDRIFLRESVSCAYAAAHGLSAALTPDLCFSASLSGRPRDDRIVVTDSTLHETTSMLRLWGRRVHARYRPMQLSRLRSLLHWAIIPGQHELAARRYLAGISEAGAVVTGRFHAAVFALLCETPFLVLESNTSKIQSLLGDVLGDRQRLICPDQLNDPDLSVPDFTPDERRRIRAYRASAAQRAQSMFDHIAQAAAVGIVGQPV